MPSSFRGRLSTSGSIKLAIFTCLYAGTFIFLYVYAQSNFDPRDVMFIYDSPAAMALIVLRCIGKSKVSKFVPEIVEPIKLYVK